MAKINFTKEHYAKLQNLAIKMLFENGTVTTRMGQVLNISELLHTTTINTLNDLRIYLGKCIERMESTDEWVSDNTTQSKLDGLKETKELVNLIIGYKRYTLEKESNKKKQEELTSQLNTLKESQKTPDERIKELEAAIAELKTDEDF
jgi:hypothetical protein